MLLFSFKTLCIIHFVFFLNILLSLIIEIEPMFSTSVASKGRSQSMRPLVSRNKINTNTQPLRSASSSSSSASSLHSIPAETDTKTIHAGPSDLAVKKALSKAVSFQPEAVVEMDAAHPIRTASRISLQEATIGTHSEHLNPARDGVYARVRNILQRYGVPIGVGVAVGVGTGVASVGAGVGYQIAKNILNNNKTSTTTVISTTTNPPTTPNTQIVITSTTDSVVNCDEIENRL